LFPNEVGLEHDYADTTLRQARAAIAATGRDVKVDTIIVAGAPAAVLLAESRTAELVCVGSSGIGVVSSRVVGSTVTTLDEEAACPVAIIRHHREGPFTDHRWIAVGVKAPIEVEDIVIAAMQEARLRHAPVVAVGLWQEDFGFTPYDEVDRLMDSWRQRYPDVRVYPVSTRSGLVAFLNDDDEPIGMVVVGPDEASRVVQIVGPPQPSDPGAPQLLRARRPGLTPERGP
jgi:hypothetical protein